jgi:hypothetical protein
VVVGWGWWFIYGIIGLAVYEEEGGVDAGGGVIIDFV